MDRLAPTRPDMSIDRVAPRVRHPDYSVDDTYPWLVANRIVFARTVPFSSMWVTVLDWLLVTHAPDAWAATPWWLRLDAHLGGVSD